MDPSQFNPPLPYDRYVNRELPILPHSASSQSFFDNNQRRSSHDLPDPGVSANMEADPFSQQFEKPSRMSGRPVLPWMGSGSDQGLIDLPPSKCGHVDPVMAGMMPPQMQPMSIDPTMNRSSLAVDQVLSAISSRNKNTPTTIRSWTLTRQSTVSRQRKPCWKDCRPCQYIGLFVFVGVLAVIGYAVYNGVIAAIVQNKTHERASSRSNDTYWTTTLASTDSTTGSPGVSTSTAAPTTVKPSTSAKKSTTTVSTTKRKMKKPKATAATSTTTTVATPHDRQPSTTTKAAKRIRKPKKPESSYCSYPIGRLMNKVHRDDGRCADSSKGIYATDGSCNTFHVCYTDGRLLAIGRCPCGRIFDEETRRCLKQKLGYYRHPHDCERYSRCTSIMSSVMRLSLRCNVGLAFDIRPKKPVCKDAKDVPGCSSR
ncbi:hypothetical protein LSAT2_019798 [Lamellibrachia satsuma]|nr:hypothetical protein LSAT2_019798 [Lamellibrachia satsuma]